MKTPVNNLMFKASHYVDGFIFDVEIRFNDECKNGHPDFAITGNQYTGDRKKDSNLVQSGATLAQYFPQYAIFDRLHLCDHNGMPMHCIANGYYHLCDKSGKMEKKRFMDYYRITSDQYDHLALGTSCIEHFAYQLMNSDILAQWKAEADQAINLLCEWTGNSFKLANVARSHWDEKIAQKASEMAEANQFTPQAAEQRIAQEIAAKKAKRLQYLRDQHAKDTSKANAALEVGLMLADISESTNYVFYNHSGELRLNWMLSTYEVAFSASEIEQARKAFDGNKWVKSITEGKNK